jgi:hypothetical protein
LLIEQKKKSYKLFLVGNQIPKKKTPIHPKFVVQHIEDEKKNIEFI